MSLEAARRGSRIRPSKTAPPDEAKEVKRRKIIREFYDTEHSYVDGLELIYSVSVLNLSALML
jgi:FYVE, RhoGEF and PH domain containing 5/6